MFRTLLETHNSQSSFYNVGLIQTRGGPRGYAGWSLGSSNPCGIYCMYNRKNTKIRLRSTWLTTLHRFGTQRSPHGRMHARRRHISQSPLGFPYRPPGCAVRLYAAGRCSWLSCRVVFESSNFADKKLTYIIVLLIIICLSRRLGKITHH